MNPKQDIKNQAVFSEKAVWVLHYRPDKVSQPWSVLAAYDNKLSAIIKAHQVSAQYFMVKVTDPNGCISWSN